MAQKISSHYLERGLDLNDHELVVLDILGERSAKRRTLDTTVEFFRSRFKKLPQVRVDAGGHDRNYYREMLGRAKFAIAPFRPCCTWSMSVVDCLAAGVPVIADDRGFFRELIPEPCLFDGSYAQCNKLCGRLTRDEDFWQECRELGKAAVAHLTPEKITARLCDGLSSHTSPPNEEPDTSKQLQNDDKRLMCGA